MSEDQNTCDVCGDVHDSEALIWIDAEDFTPRPGEEIDPAKSDGVTAACESCYPGLLAAANGLGND
jgi:hypothetical protein